MLLSVVFPDLMSLMQPFWYSLKLAGITTLCLILLGTPLAYWLSLKSQHHWIARIKLVVLGITALPLILPPTVIGFYLLLAFSPNHWSGQLLMQLGIGPLAFTFQGLVISSIIYSLPFFVQPVYAQFKAISQSVHDAAHMLEASAWRRLVFVMLPQAKVGLTLGSLISFAHTIGEFGVVLMIGGSISAETKVASIAIYEQVESLNYTAAHQMSLLLLLFALVILSLIAMLNKKTSKQ